MEYLRQRPPQLIKASKLQVKPRKVITWTDVLIGNCNFPQLIKRTTIEYHLGDVLGERRADPPAAIAGIIIDMPLENPQIELAKILQLENLLSDQQLLDYLYKTSFEIKQSKQAIVKDAQAEEDHLDLLNSVFFQQMSSEEQ